MKLNDYYSTIVVGAGPAGIMAARQAAKRGSVLLLERMNLPRSKSCGGMLNPYSVRFLENVCAKVPKRVICEPQKINFRFFDWDRDIRKATKLEFLNVDRKAFDEWTLQLLPNNVEVAENMCFISCNENESKVYVTVRQADSQADKKATLKKIACDFLVACDGPRSSVRRSMDVSQLSLYKTLQEFIPYDNNPCEPFFDCVYSRHIGSDYGYGYIIPKSEHFIVGSVFFPHAKNCASLHDTAIKTFSKYYNFKDASTKREAWSAVKAQSVKDIVAGRGRVLFAGEAAGIISPSSGEGISFAMNSGNLAGQAVCSSDDASLVLSNYETSLKPIKRVMAQRLRYFPVLNSGWGKWLGGSSPNFLVDFVAHRI